VNFGQVPEMPLGPFAKPSELIPLALVEDLFVKVKANGLTVSVPLVTGP
jgi:hypothetical protein